MPDDRRGAHPDRRERGPADAARRARFEASHNLLRPSGLSPRAIGPTGRRHATRAGYPVGWCARPPRRQPDIGAGLAGIDFLRDGLRRVRRLGAV